MGPLVARSDYIIEPGWLFELTCDKTQHLLKSLNICHSSRMNKTILITLYPSNDFDRENQQSSLEIAAKLEMRSLSKGNKNSTLH